VSASGRGPVVVRCPSWEHRTTTRGAPAGFQGPTTREAAEKWLAGVEALGACAGPHEVIEVPVSP
jgi:hypothetical protein